MSDGDGLGWLPPLLLFADYQGDWNRYLEAVYTCFRQEFILSSPIREGVRVAMKRHPLSEGKEATFWHLISEGRVEADRLPDLRRCERIRWPRPMIESTQVEQVKCWKNTRRGEPRLVLALGDFSYVVVLAVRPGYLLLWTAYHVEEDHRRNKLRREFEASVGG